MAKVRICVFADCKTILSTYNSGKLCSVHRKEAPPSYVAMELAGLKIHDDDHWVQAKINPRWPTPSWRDTVSSWKDHMFSQEFLDGMPEAWTRVMSRDYDTGRWLSPSTEEKRIVDL